jgi:hypothetical protein
VIEENARVAQVGALTQSSLQAKDHGVLNKASRYEGVWKSVGIAPHIL